MRIEPKVSRRMGMMGFFVSWWGFCLVRGNPVSERLIIRML